MRAAILRTACTAFLILCAAGPVAALDDREEIEARLAKLEKRYGKEITRCREGDRRVCERAKLTYADIQELKRRLSAEAED